MVRAIVLAGAAAWALATVGAGSGPQAAADQPQSSCPEGQIVVDAPSTSYWICQAGSYVWVRTGNDPDSGMGYGNRPGRPNPGPPPE